MQAQLPLWHVRFAAHLFAQLPQFALSVCRLTQLPQFDAPAAQQMLAPLTE